MWNQLCLLVCEDGGICGTEINPGCTDAQCVFDKMPDGTVWEVVTPNLNGVAWDAVQVQDKMAYDTTDGLRPLERVALGTPILWMRVDSTDDVDDLTTYKHRLHFGKWENLYMQAYDKLEVVVLLPPEVLPVELPEVGIRR